MFMGTYYNSIDAKNRMIVPSKHREQLDGRCVLTVGMDTCLYIYPMEEWEKQVDKLSILPETDGNVRKLIRDYFSNAVECEIDKQGRIVIPQELKKSACIDKELVTMGAMRKIEVWSKEIWDAQDDENEVGSKEYIATLTKYNL